MKNIKLIVTNSIGELDVFLPVISRILAHKTVKVEIIFAKNELFEKYNTSGQYKKLCARLNIKVSKYLFFKEYSNDRHIFKVFKWLRYVIASFLFIIKKRNTNILFSDFTDDKFIIRPLQYIVHWKGGTVIAIPHAMAILEDSAIVETQNPPRFVKMYCFDKKTIRTHNDYGYKSVSTIGYVKAYSEWLDILQSVRDEDNIRDDFALIFCRDIHEHYMSKEKFEYLIPSMYHAIRKIFPQIQIVYKLHPRQSRQVFDQFCRNNGFENFSISTGNPTIEVMGAKFSISTWSSAIIDAYIHQIPNCEYFIEDNAFLELEPSGSIYRKDGFSSFMNEADLFCWLNQGPVFQNVKAMEERFSSNSMPGDKFLNLFGINNNI